MKLNEAQRAYDADPNPCTARFLSKAKARAGIRTKFKYLQFIKDPTEGRKIHWQASNPIPGHGGNDRPLSDFIACSTQAYAPFSWCQKVFKILPDGYVLDENKDKLCGRCAKLLKRKGYFD